MCGIKRGPQEEDDDQEGGDGAIQGFYYARAKKKRICANTKPPFLFRFSPLYISIEREPWILLFSFHKSRRRRPSHTVFVLRALSDIKRTNWGGRWWSNSFSFFSRFLLRAAYKNLLNLCGPLQAKWTGSATSIGRETT